MFGNSKNNFKKWIRMGNIFFLSISFIPYLANASDSDHTQLLRNSTLETAALYKSMLPVNSPKKFSMGNAAALTDKKITDKSKELEGVFLSVMLEPMFPDGKQSNLYGGGNGQDIFRSMMIQQYGQVLANAGGVGLRSGIEKQLRRQQTNSSAQNVSVKE